MKAETKETRFRVSVFIFSLLLLWPFESVWAEGPCATIKPIPTLELKPMYSDAKASIENKGNEADNGRIMAPIFDFFRSLEKALDDPNARPGNHLSDCAFTLFGQWAEAGALTFEPSVYEGQGKVKRGLINPGFQVLGIKFRAAGYSLTAKMLSWLKKMNQENVKFYAKGSNRGNQRIWAATGAALNSVLERDAGALQFQDGVWNEAMSAIQDSGFIDAELARGQQALVYHIYSYAATIVLEHTRAALGYKETASDQQRIRRLEDVIAKTLCDPSEMGRLAKAKIRIPDGEWAYEVTNGFGGSALEAKWSKCKPPAKDFNARDMGGDSRNSAKILAQLAQSHSGSK